MGGVRFGFHDFAMPTKCLPKSKVSGLTYEFETASRVQPIDVQLRAIDDTMKESKMSQLQGAAEMEDDSEDWMHKAFDEVVVITMPQRQDFVTKSLASWGLKKASFFQAFDKQHLDFDKLKSSGFLPHYAEASNMSNIGNLEYKYTPGRVACHYSHSAALKYLVKKGVGKALILEDDLELVNAAQLRERKSTFNKVMRHLPADWKVVNFGRCWDDCEQDRVVAPGIVQSQKPLCRNAYGVTLEGAKELLDFTVPMVRIGDHGYSMKVSYSASPRVFYQDRNHTNSNVGNRDICPECLDKQPPPHLRGSY